MDKKKLILLVGALVVAIGTALAARSMFAGAAAPEAEAQVAPEGPKVLVAKRGLPVGTIITADAVAYQLWPQELVQDAYFIDGEANMDQLLGTVVRNAMTAGEPVTQGSLVSPGDRGFLAAALGPGMRAVTVPVSQRTGVAGFVFPGDRVDMVLTQSVRGSGDDGDALKTSETILTNLRVLATDQSTETTTTEDGRTEVRAFRTVTMEVTPRIAEKIAVAQTIGTISLALRSIADNQTELERAIASGDVELPEDATPEEEEALLRSAVARPGEGGSTFVTGGDVSRFQRSSVPSRAPRQQAQAQAPAQQGEPATNVPPAYRGPVVRVSRGQAVTIEPVNSGAGRMLDRQADGMNQAGRAASIGMSTLR